MYFEQRRNLFVGNLSIYYRLYSEVMEKTKNMRPNNFSKLYSAIPLKGNVCYTKIIMFVIQSFRKPQIGRLFCLSEVRECWLLIYSSNLSKSAYNFYTYT